MVNRMIRLMWPKLTAAIFDEVIKMLKPMMQQTFKQVKQQRRPQEWTAYAAAATVPTPAAGPTYTATAGQQVAPEASHQS
jgi:hypothetical protein